MIEIELRAEIAYLESLTAGANNDLATHGSWQCDWSEGFRESKSKIDKMICDLTKKPKEPK